MWQHPLVWKIYWSGFLPHTCTLNLACSVNEGSSEGNDSELSDKTGCQKSGAFHLCMPIGFSWSVTQVMVAFLFYF